MIYLCCCLTAAAAAHLGMVFPRLIGELLPSTRGKQRKGSAVCVAGLAGMEATLPSKAASVRESKAPKVGNKAHCAALVFLFYTETMTSYSESSPRRPCIEQPVCVHSCVLLKSRMQKAFFFSYYSLCHEIWHSCKNSLPCYPCPHCAVFGLRKADKKSKS